eukprot:12421112-Karenia_brevis.AAC.1
MGGAAKAEFWFGLCFWQAFDRCACKEVKAQLTSACPVALLKQLRAHDVNDDDDDDCDSIDD